MATTTLDSFLNFMIPFGIVIFFSALIYWKLREPLNTFGRWLKSLFVSATDNISEVNLPTEIVYK
jgi:hypothetical protein